MSDRDYSVSGYKNGSAIYFKQKIELSVTCYRREKINKEMWVAGKLQKPVDICPATVHSIRLLMNSRNGTDYSIRLYQIHIQIHLLKEFSCQQYEALEIPM